jgi:hypothetical protein
MQSMHRMINTQLRDKMVVQKGDYILDEKECQEIV